MPFGLACAQQTGLRASLSATVLVPNAPLKALANGGQYNQYNVTFAPPVLGLAFRVSAVKGFPNLFVSNTPNPTSTSYVWSATGQVNETVYISQSDPHFPASFPTTLYASVFAAGDQHAIYTIEADVLA